MVFYLGLINILTIFIILVIYEIPLLRYTNKQWIKQISLFSSILSLLIVIIYWLSFNYNYLGWQFLESWAHFNWGVDSISLILVLLTAFLIPIALLSNWNNINKADSFYVSLVLLLGLLMTLNFLCLDMVSFYILFESTLAPLFLLIGIYGASNRDRAAYFVLVYTLASSLFMLISIAFYSFILHSPDYDAASQFILNIDLQAILWFFISIGLAVKTPLMPLHTWLPVVHSESPLAGSILLAGVVLKLAIYGIIRLLLPNLSEASSLFTPAVFLLAIITLIYISLITIRQVDLKVIIAYSSISHLAVCILGIFANNLLGIEGSLILSIAHGLVSPALFAAVGGILYDRYHNRLLFYFQGLGEFMPLFAVYLVVFSFCNTGTPLSANFIGELLSISGAFIRHPFIASFAVLSVLLSACYQMKLTNKLTGGSKSPFLVMTNDLTNREISLFNYLLIPTIFLGLYPSALTNIINLSSSSLLYHII